MTNDDAKVEKIDPSLLIRLGRFVVNWAYLEDFLGDLFAAVVSADPGNLRVVTQNVSSATLTEWIRTTIRFRPTPEESAAELEKLLNEIDELRAERNSLVHGLWGTAEGHSTIALIQTVRIGRREPGRDWAVTTADLDALVDETQNLTFRLVAFLRTHEFPRARES
jgi:hypothetical protein